MMNCMRVKERHFATWIGFQGVQLNRGGCAFLKENRAGQGVCGGHVGFEDVQIS